MVEEQTTVTSLGGKSGDGQAKFTSGARLFYATQNPMILEYGWQQAYGYDPKKNRPYMIRIYYTMHDADDKPIKKRMQVGGYVSVYHRQIFSGNRFPALRLGVSLIQIKNALQARLHMARGMIGKGNPEFKHEKDWYLKRCAQILEFRIKKLDYLISKGNEHVVLLMAWRKKIRKKKLIIDHIDLNQDFFDVFYPARAFPIGSSANAKEEGSWVNGDYFIYPMFPINYNRPAMKKMKEKNIIPPANNWKFKKIEEKAGGWTIRLKITFNQNLGNAWNKQPEAVKKPEIKPVIKPPKDAVKEAEQKLKETEDDKEKKKVSENTVRVIDQVEERADKEKQAGKGGAADIHQQLAEQAKETLRKVFRQEKDKMIGEIRGTPAMGDNVDEVIDKAMGLYQDYRVIVHEEQYGDDPNMDMENELDELKEACADLLETRVDTKMGNIGTMDANDKNLEGAIEDALNDGTKMVSLSPGRSVDFSPAGEKMNERAEGKLKGLDETENPSVSQVTGVMESALQDKATAQLLGGEVETNMNEHYNRVNEKGKTAIEQLDSSKKDSWNTVQILRLWSELTLSASELRKMRSDLRTNFRAQNEEFMLKCKADGKDITDPAFKAAVILQIRVFNLPLPTELENYDDVPLLKIKLEDRGTEVVPRQIPIENEEAPEEATTIG